MELILTKIANANVNVNEGSVYLPMLEMIFAAYCPMAR